MILCSIGTEFGWNEDGYISNGGTDVDRSQFTGWQEIDTSSFLEPYKQILDQILYCDKVQNAISVNKDSVLQAALQEYYNNRDRNIMMLQFGGYNKEVLSKMTSQELFMLYESERENISVKIESLSIKNGISSKNEYMYMHFYNSSPIMNIPLNAHQSYIDACFGVVEHIMANQEMYNKNREHKACVPAAKNWLKKYRALRNIDKLVE
jgi:hypothetical protein